MKLELIFLSFIIAFIFSSCEKCKDCELKYEFINNDDAQALYELAKEERLFKKSSRTYRYYFFRL